VGIAAWFAPVGWRATRPACGDRWKRTDAVVYLPVPLDGAWRWCRILRQRTTKSSRGLTSTIGRGSGPLCGLESPLGRGMLRPSGTPSSGQLLPDGVLLREVGGVLEHLGGPLVDARRMLG
jgi:hypothetical protein